jgi:DNA-binding MarR family transcriptional regulator
MAPAPDTRSKTDCHCYRLRMAARRVTQVYDRELKGSGLSISQYGLLGHLRRLDGISLGALADVLLLDGTAVMRSLKPLEKQGFVVVAVGQKDKRTRRVHLTPTGRAAYEAARPAWTRAQARVTRTIGGEDKDAFAATIDRLLDDLTPLWMIP